MLPVQKRETLQTVIYYTRWDTPPYAPPPTPPGQPPHYLMQWLQEISTIKKFEPIRGDPVVQLEEERQGFYVWEDEVQVVLSQCQLEQFLQEKTQKEAQQLEYLMNGGAKFPQQDPDTPPKEDCTKMMNQQSSSANDLHETRVEYKSIFCSCGVHRALRATCEYCTKKVPAANRVYRCKEGFITKGETRNGAYRIIRYRTREIHVYCKVCDEVEGGHGEILGEIISGCRRERQEDHDEEKH